MSVSHTRYSRVPGGMATLWYGSNSRVVALGAPEIITLSFRNSSVVFGGIPVGGLIAIR
ncbi:hypothetical protein SNOUR_25285 [Streptomyces noursei ATCC 11455]|nr:hypothetical protein SNOUR_25285 [Streptomyces noursei ATCC 11455]